MLCRNCGKPIEPGDGFCVSCGTPVSSGQPPVPQAQPQTIAAPGKGGFFSTPGGIVTLVAIALLVIGGVVLGVILATGGGGQQEIVQAWEEFCGVTEDIDGELDQVSDLSKASSGDIKVFQDTIEKSRKKLDGILEGLPSGESDSSYESLKSAIEKYDDYLKRLDGFYHDYLQDPSDKNLSSTLEDLEELASEVESELKGFLKDNDLASAKECSLSVLELPSKYSKQLAVAQDDTGKDEGDDDQVKSGEEEVADAQAVLGEILPMYAEGGWQALTGYMTPEMYQAYENAPIPWDQVSYVVTGTRILNHTVVDKNTILFTVEETQDDFGDVFTANLEWEMVGSGNIWQVNNQRSPDDYSLW